MPVAHPTPDFTVMAWVEQFMAQAPHSMQESLCCNDAFLSFMIITAKRANCTCSFVNFSIAITKIQFAKVRIVFNIKKVQEMFRIFVN